MCCDFCDPSSSATGSNRLRIRVQIHISLSGGTTAFACPLFPYPSVKSNLLWNLTHIFMALSFPAGSLFKWKVSPCPPCAGHLAHPRGWDRPPGQFRLSYEPLHRAAAQRAGTAEGLQHPAQSLIYAAEDPWSGKVRWISLKPLPCKASECILFTVWLFYLKLFFV